MQQRPNFLPRQIRLNSRFFLALLAAESLLLSLLHHLFNFWGWPGSKQAVVVLVLAPVLAVILDRILSPLWGAIAGICFRRWLLFLVPAAIIAGFGAWHFVSPPEVEHRLGVVAVGRVQVREIRGPYGNVVPLWTFANRPGWKLDGELLVSDGSQGNPLLYAFNGPINQRVRITFVVAQSAGQAQVSLDGQQASLDLSGADGDERRARLDTSYRWGRLNFLIMPLILAMDLCALLVVLAGLWLMQEVTQSEGGEAAEPAKQRFASHIPGLLAVCVVALVLHAVNFLAVPLAVLKDSPSYLQGAVYWIEHHSLDGVSSYRGPGTTFLFTPAMALFGRNPLGLKLMLHLLAFGCVPLSYRLGWQLGRRRWFAVAAGLVTALLPDLYAYSSFVLSEAAHAFFGLLFCTLLLSALESASFGWILATLAAGAFAVLLRSEDAALLVLGAGLILARILWLKSRVRVLGGAVPIPVWQFGLALLIAAVPLLAWSVHNQRVYGFFGLSDYGGEILYDGWVYFGEDSPITITDHQSPAVRLIEAVHPIAKPAQGDAPTGWAIYGALLQHGYTSEQAFGLLQHAALDSIRKDPAATLRLLAFKLRQGFEPHPFVPATFLLPGEHMAADTLNADYFDEESITIPALIALQRSANSLVAQWYGSVFTAWLWLGLLLLFISLYRRPFFLWFTLGVISLNSVLLPLSIGMSMWRYVLLGLLLLTYPILSGVQSAGRFILYYLHASGIDRLRAKTPKTA